MADIVIIGAGTAGLTAAIYARRAGKSVTVLEAATYGGQIVNTPDIENYPGIKHISGFDFATGLYDQATSLGAEVLFEKATRGRAMHGFTRNYIRVELPASASRPELDNQLVRVRLGEFNHDHSALKAEIIING